MNEPEITSDTRKLQSGWARDAEEVYRRIHALTDKEWCGIFDETVKHMLSEKVEWGKPITMIYCRDPMIKPSWKNFFLPPKKFFVLNEDGKMDDVFGSYGGLPVPRKHEKIPGTSFHRNNVK